MRSLPFLLASLLIFTAYAEESVHTLSLSEARALALKKHPKLSVAELTSLAVRQTVDANRAAYLPNVSAGAGVVATSESGLRAASTGLSLSGIYDRGSLSLNVSQLITDFGRTSNLIASSRLKASAEEQNVLATRQQIVLEVDTAYFNVLQASAVQDVAQQTVKTRGLLRDNTNALQKNQLKSALDASFAEVNLQEAELLLARARNDLLSASATLARLLMDPEKTVYHLRSPDEPEALPGSVTSLVQMALKNRPELERLRLEHEAAQKFASAERALKHPTLSVQGTAGTMPYRDKDLDQNYAAAGLVLSWPITSGGLNSARQREAELRMQAAEQSLKDKEAEIRRDVQLAWLNATNANERVGITARLHEQATQAYSLAEARYNAGSSSMVELSQAQFNLISAEITQTTTRYESLLRHSALRYQVGTLAPVAGSAEKASSSTGK